MSTWIRSQSDPDDFGVQITGCRGQVEIQSASRTGGGTFRASRADLLAAVATECDAIVIDRADLPKVCVDTSGRPGIPGVTPEIRTQSAGKARHLAACWLALAEYLDAHPPVDPAQVEALEQIIRETSLELVVGADRVARRLVARGVRVDLP